MKNSKGFTLIEILLVMLITSVLVLGVNAAFRQSHMLWSRVESQRPVYQKTRLLYDTLRQELSCLYMPKIDEQQGGASFTLSSIPDGNLKLSFFSLNPAWKDSTSSNLPSKITYEFTADQDSGSKSIVRSEQLSSGEKLIAAVQKETILEGFSKVSIQAADPNSETLSDLWKHDLHRNGNPPKAIKIILSWPKNGHADFEFETIIKIGCDVQLIQP